MAKLKDISSSVDSRQAMAGMSSSQVVTSVEDVDMFNNVMDVADSASTQNEEQQQDTNPQNDENNQVKSADKPAESKGSEEVKEDNDKVKLSEEEQNAIDEQKINVQELARQLNVMLDKLVQPVQQQVQVQLPKGNLGRSLIAKKIDGTETVEVDPELIKRVDVKTLREQMELAMKGTSGPDTFPEVPESMKQQLQDNQPKVVQTLLPHQVQTQVVKANDTDLHQDMLMQKMNERAQIQVDLKTQRQEVDVEIESAQIAEFLTAERTEIQFTDKELPLPVSDGPDVMLNVVAAYADVNSVFERLSEMRSSDEPMPLLDLLLNQDTPLHKDDVLSLIADQLVQSTSAQQMTPGLQMHPTNQTTQSPQQLPLQILGDTMMQPVMQKISNIIMNMSRDGKSGITRVQIYPPELGSVNIKFQMKDGSVKAEIIAEQEVTKRIIEKSLPELKDIFSKDNVTVDSFVVKHSKEHFETPQQKTVTDFALEKHQQDQARHGSSYNSEAKSEQMRRLHNMIAERRALQSSNRFEVTV